MTDEILITSTLDRYYIVTIGSSDFSIVEKNGEKSSSEFLFKEIFKKLFEIGRAHV